MEIVSQQEQRNKRYGMITSVVMHTLILIIGLLPFFTYPDPPPGQEGILVNLGLPDQGQGEEDAAPAETSQEREAEPETEPEPVIEKPVEKPQKTEPTPQKEVIKTEDPDAIALREQKKREQAEQERKQREEEAKKRAAEEEARKKAEADKLKGEIGGLFGNGKGKGSSGKTGNQGQPDGDPNGKALEGVSTGTGTIGGGLGSRGVARAPKIEDNTQQEGTVVLQVCVDQEGNVVSAEFTQKGSTISDGSLKNKAINNAKQWKFNRGDVEKQCGTITYRFRVK